METHPRCFSNRTERGLGRRVLRATCKPSAVSTAQLHPLPGFHLRPIKPVVSRRPYPVKAGGGPYLGVGFPLRCFQRLSRPDVGYPAMPLARQPAHQRSVHPGPLVLGAAPLKPPTPTADRDRPVSRRSEPSSRTALTGEQPDPWDLVQPQDAMRVPHRFRWRRLYHHPGHRHTRGPASDGQHRFGIPFRPQGRPSRALRPQSLRGQRSLYPISGGIWGRIRSQKRCAIRAGR